MEYAVRNAEFVRKPGKTKADRLSGAHERNARNKALRADWGNDTHASAASFPSETCNGKRSQALRRRRTKKRA